MHLCCIAHKKAVVLVPKSPALQQDHLVHSLQCGIETVVFVPSIWGATSSLKLEHVVPRS